MNLRDRLERALGPSSPPPQEKPSPGSSLQDRLERLVGDRAIPEEKRKRKPKLSIEEAVGGEVIESADGASLLVSNCFSKDHLQGSVTISDIHGLHCSTMAVMGGDARLAELSIEELLFLDTETTGLSGGAGTCAFLVGAGFFEDGCFKIHQFFMRDFNEEKAMLGHFRKLLQKARGLVTFNGKAFDAPLLEGRYVLQRKKTQLSALPHLDLLFPSRKLWKGLYEDCRLATLEGKVLGCPRHDDIDGSLIPQGYFDYLHRGDTSMISRIFIHNRHDIVTLAALAVRIGKMLENPMDERGQGLLRLGRIHAERGDISVGKSCLAKALETGLGASDKALAAKELSLQYRREGRHGESAAILEKLTEKGDCSDPSLYIELAKHYEHREKNYQKALHLVNAVLRSIPPGETSLREALLHRKARLERKI